MAKSTLKIKSLSDKELNLEMSKAELLLDKLVFEYHRRQAMHIKKHSPEYYEAHFRKIYG